MQFFYYTKLQKNIFFLQKKIFFLRILKKKNKKIKSHFFIHLKRKIIFLKLKK